jgi:nicotinamidase-related amidase
VDLDHAALIIIDLQKAIDDPRWATLGPRNNPQAETNAAALLAAWRAAGRPLFHVRHDSAEPYSTYRPGGPGHPFKPEVQPLPGEPVVAKTVQSAFVGTDLVQRLRAAGSRTAAVCGVITNNSVEATVRNGANLGFDILLAEDACFTFPMRDFRGRLRTADEVHAMSLANLDDEYCRVVRTQDLLRN